MPFEIKIPQLGLTMETGTILKWMVKEGDTVVPGQELFEIETDKSVMTVEAHQEGVIGRILAPVGQELPVGTPVCVVLTPGESLPPDWKSSQPLETITARMEPTTQPMEAAATILDEGGLQASWKARMQAREAGLELSSITGSGPWGCIVAADVARALEREAGVTVGKIKATPVAAKLAESLGLSLSTISGSGPNDRIMQSDVIEAAAAILRQQREVRSRLVTTKIKHTIPLKGVRGLVTERMTTSARSTARVTLMRQVDATEMISLRNGFEDEGTQVSFNDILIRISAIALSEHPGANARLGDGKIEYLEEIHIGLAVETERGLLVPVVQHADRMTIPQIAAETQSLIEAANAGRIPPDDLVGGTFTVTNLGVLGVESFTPVINLPECCILGVGRILRKPVVIDEKDTIAVRPRMTLSLVFDHRVIDGAPAARFLDRIAQLVEQPTLV